MAREFQVVVVDAKYKRPEEIRSHPNFKREQALVRQFINQCSCLCDVQKGFERCYAGSLRMSVLQRLPHDSKPKRVWTLPRYLRGVSGAEIGYRGCHGGHCSQSGNRKYRGEVHQQQSVSHPHNGERDYNTLFRRVSVADGGVYKLSTAVFGDRRRSSSRRVSTQISDMSAVSVGHDTCQPTVAYGPCSRKYKRPQQWKQRLGLFPSPGPVPTVRPERCVSGETQLARVQSSPRRLHIRRNAWLRLQRWNQRRSNLASTLRRKRRSGPHHDHHGTGPEAQCRQRKLPSNGESAAETSTTTATSAANNHIGFGQVSSQYSKFNARGLRQTIAVANTAGYNCAIQKSDLLYKQSQWYMCLEDRAVYRIEKERLRWRELVTNERGILLQRIRIQTMYENLPQWRWTRKRHPSVGVLCPDAWRLRRSTGMAVQEQGDPGCVGSFQWARSAGKGRPLQARPKQQLLSTTESGQQCCQRQSALHVAPGVGKIPQERYTLSSHGSAPDMKRIHQLFHTAYFIYPNTVSFIKEVMHQIITDDQKYNFSYHPKITLLTPPRNSSLITKNLALCHSPEVHDFNFCLINDISPLLSFFKTSYCFVNHLFLFAYYSVKYLLLYFHLMRQIHIFCSLPQISENHDNRYLSVQYLNGKLVFKLI